MSPFLASPVSQEGRGGPQWGLAPSPQVANPREPGTNLSPVTGSVLLRVSRSMTESNGTFRKNTLQGRNRHHDQLERTQPRGQHPPRKWAGPREPSEVLGRVQAGPPCCGSSLHP